QAQPHQCGSRDAADLSSSGLALKRLQLERGLREARGFLRGYEDPAAVAAKRSRWVVQPTARAGDRRWHPGEASPTTGRPAGGGGRRRAARLPTRASRPAPVSPGAGRGTAYGWPFVTASTAGTAGGFGEGPTSEPTSRPISTPASALPDPPSPPLTDTSGTNF